MFPRDMPTPRSPSQTQNPSAARIGNFDLLRLLFSLSVVYMHSVRILDGDNHREILQRLFGIRALMGYGSGDLAVDGFLAMSGYFAVGAWNRSGGLANYLRNRALRIYPGFVAASLLSQTLFVVLATGVVVPWIHEISLARRVWELALLQFPTAHFPFHAGAWFLRDLPPVNAPLWVIAHEARCYLLTAAVGCLAARFGSRWTLRAWWVLFAAALFLIASGLTIPRFPGYVLVIDNQTYCLRFTACFAAGCLFFLHQDRLLGLEKTIPVTALLFAACLARESWLPLAIPTLLAVLVLQVGTSPTLSAWLPRLEIDLSYGIFLYSWPVQIALLRRFPDLGLWLFPLSALVAAGLSWASLVAVERPFLRWKANGPRVIKGP